MKKLLIIRFSSFGDIVQSLSCIPNYKALYPNSRIDFLTKSNFSSIVELDSQIDQVISFDKSTGIKGLISLCLSLRHENYQLIYDAHSNMRSLVVKLVLLGPFFFLSKKLIVRSKQRMKRLMLFRFRVNLFNSWPFIAKKSFLDPLGLENKRRSNFNFEGIKKDLPLNKISLVLGANWDLKIWPQKHWEGLIELLDESVVLLGGKLEESVALNLENKFQDKVINLVGKISLKESSYIVSKSKCFVSADTGLLHIADALGVKGICLMGPTAFGYPESDQIRVLEISELKCRPCSKDGRGKCSQDVYKKCMINLTPKLVAENIYEICN